MELVHLFVANKKKYRENEDDMAQVLTQDKIKKINRKTKEREGKEETSMSTEKKQQSKLRTWRRGWTEIDKKIQGQRTKMNNRNKHKWWAKPTTAKEQKNRTGKRRAARKTGREDSKNEGKQQQNSQQNK